MRRAVIFVVSALMLGVGVCGAQESDDGGTMDWVLVPVGTDGKHFKVQQIGKVPTAVIPDRGRGCKVQTPGRMPPSARPPIGGGFTVGKVGKVATRVTPEWGGGYKIETPGEPTTYVRPQVGGGYTIGKFGEFPTRVTPEWGGVQGPDAGRVADVRAAADRRRLHDQQVRRVPDAGDPRVGGRVQDPDPR